MSVTNKRVALMWYCKTRSDAGKVIWRRFPAILFGEGPKREAKVGWVLDKNNKDEGKKDKDGHTEYPDGYFQARTWDKGKQVYQTLNAKHGRDAVGEWESITRKAVTAAKLASGELRRAVTVKSGAAAYVTDLQRERKFEAAEHARLVLADFDKVCFPFTIKTISRDSILRYHAALRRRKLSERTIANKHNRIRSFLKWYKIDTSFMPDAPRYDKKTTPDIYNVNQIDAIRAAANEYMRLAIDMALMLGLREGEITYACWPDVDFHHATFRVTSKPELGFRIKDSEERLLPIPRELLERLDARHKLVPDSRLILGTKNNAPNGHLLRMLKSLAQKSGLNCRECQSCREHVPASPDSWRRLTSRPRDPMAGQECEEWTLHRFRRTCLTTMLRNGFDARTVQSLAGHSQLETTLLYLSPATADEMHDKINAIQWGSGNGERKRKVVKAGKRSKIGRKVAHK